MTQQSDLPLLAGLHVTMVGTVSRATQTVAELLADLGAEVVQGGRTWEPGTDVVITCASGEELQRDKLYEPLESFTRTGVWLSVTPWGLHGPLSDAPASDLVIGAESGLQYTIGEPAREPLRLPGELPSTITANAAFTAVLAALVFRDDTGLGQVVDVSALAVMTSNHEFATVLYSHTGRIRERQGGRLMGSAPWTMLPCKDGWVGVIVPEGRWDDFVQVSGIAELEAPKFSTRAGRVEHVLELEAILTRWMSTQTEAELYEFAQALFLPWAPVSSLKECLNDPHIVARRFRRPDGTYRFPALFTFSERAAPQPGPTTHGHTQAPGPLSGVRVLDFGIAWAGALTGRQLGDMGADVIKIETRRRLDTRGALVPVPTGIYVANRATDKPWNRSGTFVDRHRNKRSIAIELDRPEGVRILRELARDSDIVIENFAPRVLENLGVGFKALSEVNPRIVYVSLSGFGHSGPRRDQAAFGDTIEQASGSTDVCGYEGGPPFNSGTHWPDTASGFLAAGTALAAWRNARKTGRGMHVDLSELEVALRAMPDLLAFVEREGNSPGRTGNRGWGATFEGAFASNDGRFLVLTVSEGSEAGLAGLLGLTSLPPEPELATLLRDFIASQTAAEAYKALQRANVPVGLVRNMAEVFEHEQLRALDFFQQATLDCDEFTTIGFTANLSRSPMRIHRPAPAFSEHYAEILHEVLGLQPSSIARLIETGAISTVPGL